MLRHGASVLKEASILFGSWLSMGVFQSLSLGMSVWRWWMHFLNRVVNVYWFDAHLMHIKKRLQS